MRQIDSRTMFGGGLNSEIEGQLGENVKKHTNHAKHNGNMVTKMRFKTKDVSNNNEQEKEVSCLTCCSILL